jgi:hypothetical protein
LLGKLEGKRQLGTTRGGWPVNIKIGFSQIGWEGLNWIHLVQELFGTL